MVELKKLKKMEKGTKIEMVKTWNNHRVCLPVGEKVTLISVDKKNGEIEICDPYGDNWKIPISYVSVK